MRWIARSSVLEDLVEIDETAIDDAQDAIEEIEGTLRDTFGPDYSVTVQVSIRPRKSAQSDDE